MDARHVEVRLAAATASVEVARTRAEGEVEVEARSTSSSSEDADAARPPDKSTSRTTWPGASPSEGKTEGGRDGGAPPPPPLPLHRQVAARVGLEGRGGETCGKAPVVGPSPLRVGVKLVQAPWEVGEKAACEKEPSGWRRRRLF
jgi:hypothetical protein